MRRVVAALVVGALALALVGPVLVRPLAAPVSADAPVDIRGTWSGIYHANIGDFPNTDVFTTEDFATGAVSGVANDNTYTLAGTVTGNKVHWTAAQDGGSYVATSDAVVSADGTALTGSGTDTNGNTGTFTFLRQTPVPSASVAAAPSPSPSSPVASSAPVVNPPGVVPPNPAPGCTFGGFGSGPPPASVAPDPSIVGQIGSQPADKLVFPGAIGVDAVGTRGRVFVVDGTSAGELAVIDGLPRDPADIHVAFRVPVGRFPDSLAVAPDSGRVFVGLEADCRIAVVDGRAPTPVLLTSIDLPGNPESVAYDQVDQRLFVALPAANEVAVIGPDLRVDGEISIGSATRLAIDPAHGWLFVTESTGPNGPGAVAVVNGKTLQIGQALPVSGPGGLAYDPTTSQLFVVEGAVNKLTGFALDSAGGLTRGHSVALDLAPSANDDAVSAVILPVSRQVLVPLAGQTRASLFSIASDGSPSYVRAISGVVGGSAAVNDPSTGRTYVSEAGLGEVAVLALDVATAAPSITFVLPGPLDISLAPQDVARSIGITTFIMLLLGAPTPIFNSTLGDNRALIERYARRKRPKALRRAAGQISPVGRLARQLVAWSHTWTGLVLYLLLAALLYAFLDNTFPFQNAARTFGTTLFGIAVGTAVSQVPGELYVRRHYRTRGKVRVALWTLFLAAACVLITRVTGVQPGYVYGIIGGFTFGIALSADDRGRMAFRGMSILLLVGLAAWFARIPFEPSVGLVSGDTGAVINQVLADIFIGAVQGTAIGLIPLKFLTGETLFTWNRWKWAVLWGAAILLFAHVVLYPVSSFTPNPSPTGLWTILFTVVVYGAIALGFWWFFRQRAIRHESYRAKAAATLGAAASEPAVPATAAASEPEPEPAPGA
jgi:hypothetical protein